MTGRKSSAALAAITCLVLTGCGLTLDVGEGFPDNEAAFLRDLQDNEELMQDTVWVTNDDSDEERAEYVDLGWAICDALAAGQNLVQVTDALREQFPDAPEVYSLATAAQENLCPSA